MNPPRWQRRRRAAAMIMALAALLLVSLTGGQLLRSLARSHRQSRQHHWSLQSLWLADSGLLRATAQLELDAEYAGETWQPNIVDVSPDGHPAVGRVEIVVLKDPTDAWRRQIRISATFPDDPQHRVLHTRQQDILLTSSGATP
ncbi:MAG TPA: hypothetical protein VMP01_20610 [Pirellulaceae bacterium]|nr:hypothetical protein [Pirellulaceae bacterium]